MSKNSIEFSLSNSEQRDSWLNSSHWTLDTDIHGQIVSRGNSTGLGHINILLDLSSTRDFRMLLCMIDMMEKILDLWDANSFFLLLI